MGLEYEVVFSPRVNKGAPPIFKEKVGGLGKFPVLVDGDITVTESGNIAEYAGVLLEKWETFLISDFPSRYLCDTYDKLHSYLPAPGDPRRYEVLHWLHSSEGTFMTHALAITYARWFQKDGSIQTTEEGLKGNVIRDFDYLEKTLISSGGEWICGKSFTVADIMMHFSITFILARELGTKGKSWGTVNKWVKNCEKEISFRKAVEATGYDLSQSG